MSLYSNCFPRTICDSFWTHEEQEVELTEEPAEHVLNGTHFHINLSRELLPLKVLVKKKRKKLISALFACQSLKVMKMLEDFHACISSMLNVLTNGWGKTKGAPFVGKKNHQFLIIIFILYYFIL